MSDDPLSLQKKGEEFMMFLGMCITEWARVEEQLFLACRDILGTSTEHTAIIYYKTPTINSRLSLLCELIDTVIPKPKNGEHRHPDFDTWKDLADLIRDSLPIRNQLAHSPVAPFIMDGSKNILAAMIHNKTVEFQSYQHPHEAAWGKEDKTPLGVTELKAHLPTMSAIQTHLRAFRRDKLKAHIAKLFPQNINILTGSD